MSANIAITPREAIQHIIPGIRLDDELQIVLAVEACRVVLDEGNMPTDDITDAFERWYRETWSKQQNEAEVHHER